MSADHPAPDERRPDDADGVATPFRDAEAWLAARGIRREPIHVEPEPEAPTGPTDPNAAAANQGSSDEGSVGGPNDRAGDAEELTARDAVRLARQAAADAALRDADAHATPERTPPRLEDDVAEAVAFLRRSTSVTPQSEGRLREKLGDRGFAPAVVAAALERARRERLVDDLAMAAALVDERRERGHAVARIRRDLRERGFDDATLEVVLHRVEREDPEAAAFAVARDKAASLTALPAETAFRRVVGHVVRRGYPEGLARKVAREAVFTARDAERTAGH